MSLDVRQFLVSGPVENALDPPFGVAERVAVDVDRTGGFEVNPDSTRSESDDDRGPQRGVMLRGAVRG